MSYVIAAPEMLAAAAADVAGIGSSLSEAHTAAAAQTTGVLAAAEDEVSAAIAAVFSAHGQGFHALGVQLNAAAEQFAQTLNAGAGSYVSTEAANLAVLGNTLLTTITGSPALSPIPASKNPTFTGSPSLLNQMETALRPSQRSPDRLRILESIRGAGLPGSKAVFQRAALPDLFQHPAKAVDGAAGGDVTDQLSGDARRADRPGPSRRQLRGRPARWRVCLAAHDLRLDRLQHDGLPDRRDRRGADLPVGAAGRHRWRSDTKGGGSHRIGDRRPRRPHVSVLGTRRAATSPSRLSNIWWQTTRPYRRRWFCCLPRLT